MYQCKCAQLRIDGRGISAWDWRDDCPMHGLSSEWYNSADQVARRARRNDRLMELQLAARKARKEARGAADS